jgi:sugar phosphate isomerase/epimerase
MTSSLRVSRSALAADIARGPSANPGGSGAHAVEATGNFGLTAPTRRQFIGGFLLATAGATLVRGAVETPRWQIGCYTRPWGKYDYRVALDGIAEAGFKFAGIMTAKGGWLVTADTPPEQVAAIAAETKSRGLGVASLSGGNFMVKNSLDDGIARLKRLVDRAVICGCPGLLIGGTDKPELADNYYKAVAECCDYAAAHGVSISLKPHGPANATGGTCRQLIEKVGHKNFGLCYDPGNIMYYSEGKLDPVDDAATVDGLMFGLCVKDWRAPKEVMLTPGAGQVDFPKVFARLRRGGFQRGPLIVEGLTPGDAAHLSAEATKARQFVTALVS